jgi:predicted Zn-dependent protease
MRILVPALLCLTLLACDGKQKQFVQLSNDGVQALQAQDYARAQGFFEQAIKLKPNDAEIHYYLGTIALRDHRAADAATSLVKAVELDALWPDAWLNLARALIETKQPADANRALDKLFALDPGHPNGHLLAAQLAIEAKERLAADKHLRAAIAGDATFAPAYLELSHLYTDVGAFDAARQVLDEGLKHAPNAPELQEALGLAWLDLGQADKASSALLTASQHPRARYAVYLNLAAALLQVGDKPAAIQALRTYLVQGSGQNADPAQLAAAARMLQHLKSPEP